MSSHPTASDASRPTARAACPAKNLSPAQRQQLALDALGGTTSVTQLAHEHHVSRKFVYQQQDRAQDALHDAFDPKPADPTDRVLFWLPVTTGFLRQLVLALVFICHSSLRGVIELFADLFDYHLSLGTVHNILQAAVATARALNTHQDLSGVKIGALDEIFQAGRPVLVGADVYYTYCYLLRLEEQRDADTWGVRLLELVDQGFHPESTIADAGTGLRAGQAQALPGTPCRGDVFHALYEIEPLVVYLDNRAYEAITARGKLEQQQAAFEKRQGRKKLNLAQNLRHARPAEAKAITLADDVALLVRWLREDILAVAGPDHASRQELLAFVIAELQAREEQCPHRIRPVRVLLANQGADLLAFCAQLDQDLAAVAAAFQVRVAVVREVLLVQELPAGSARRWRREAALWQQLGGRYHTRVQAVAAVRGQVVRASSVIENLNSRLRNYFFLRRQLGADYLSLLQLFLNHRRFLRSEHPEREGHSPAEVLTGQPHAHWLERLGYTRFRRN